MHRSMIPAVLTVAALFATLPLFAADNGFYLGGAVGQASFVTGDGSEIEFDGDATGYKVFAGGRFITFVGLEASYVDFGDIDDQIDEELYTADVTGFTLQGVAYLPLGIADIFAKAGLFEWEADLESISTGSTATASSDGNDLVYGLGVQFRIKSFAIRAEVEYFDVETADELYMYSLGGSYTF